MPKASPCVLMEIWGGAYICVVSPLFGCGAFIWKVEVCGGVVDGVK